MKIRKYIRKKRMILIKKIKKKMRLGMTNYPRVHAGSKNTWAYERPFEIETLRKPIEAFKSCNKKVKSTMIVKDKEKSFDIKRAEDIFDQLMSNDKLSYLAIT